MFISTSMKFRKRKKFRYGTHTSPFQAMVPQECSAKYSVRHDSNNMHIMIEPRTISPHKRASPLTKCQIHRLTLNK